MPAPLSALQLRRQDAIERSLAGEPIETICREMGGAKSWLYKWKNRDLSRNREISEQVVWLNRQYGETEAQLSRSAITPSIRADSSQDEGI